MTLRSLLAVIIALSPMAASNAGDIDPPVGPVGPTMKTLQQVEPRSFLANDPAAMIPVVIDAPGSYYLIEDIYALPGQHGILISADHVRLDLRGFAVVGNRATMTLNGIHVADGVSDVIIINGMVRDNPGHGIGAANAIAVQVERVSASDNSLSGIRVGEGASVLGCLASGNGALAAGISTFAGIHVGSGSTVTSCTAINNTGFGIAGSQSSISHCSARGTRKYPSDPPNISDGAGFSGVSSFTNCSASDNEDDGFSVSYGSLVNCVARSNAAGGFSVEYSVVSECNASFNGYGFISIMDTTFDRCTAKFNTGSGFSVNYGGTVRDCTAAGNGGNGVWVGYDARIIGNLSRDNGLAGIYAPGDSNRLEGNSVQLNAKGLEVTGINNLVIGNSARGNGTNYDVAAGNEQGQVVVNPGMGFVNSNPWSNFAY